ncbi:ABC transporter ATP-binding protein [Microbacterium sp. R86528]|uniref:ABC transporter ATP-binding protein n=1 Tax=Microbacterium sp. R86528 TaxID=3093864 RepID=UPI0037C66F72
MPSLSAEQHTHTSSADLAIQTHGLTKRFHKHAAVAGIDLAVPRGSVFGFLGPNGSGKTTTIRMLLGLVRPTSGEAYVLGSPMPRTFATVLPRVGALVEGPAFWPYLSGEQNLQRMDAADPRSDARSRNKRVASALERVGLSHAAGKKAHAYSLGMKQRLGLANALLTPRELLVLDEPTNGLDPQGTREVRALVQSVADEGATVFVSSHLLAEVEQVCTHVGIMSAGSLVSQGTLDDFRSGGGGARARVDTPDVAVAKRVLAGLGLIVAPSSAGAADATAIVATLPDEAADPRPDVIVAALVQEGVRVNGFAVERTSLEQRFVELTGEGFDVVA